MKMILFTPVLILCFLHLGNCWTTEDLELFDLVESTPQTFYQVLGVDEKASGSDIKKAYRKLSTLLHPDRNKNENAEEEFRKVAAVAEVLKSEERRKTYDLILKMGLPDWRAPIYYYRRVRNLALFEMTIFLFVLATLGQYIFAWTAYWEKKYEIEEVVLSKIRKKAKHQRKGNSAKIEEEIMVSEAMSTLHKPRCQDLFPVLLFYFTINLIKSSPSRIASCVSYFKNRSTAAPKEVEEDENEDISVPRVRTRKIVKPAIPDYSCAPDYDNTREAVSAFQNKTDDAPNEIKHKNWSTDKLTEEQIAEFKKALKKFPNGTLQRWEKVASFLDCTVSEVVAMVKQMKSSQFSKAVPISMQGVTGTEKENYGCELYVEKDASDQNNYNNLKNSLNFDSSPADTDVSQQNGNAHHNGTNVPIEKIWKQEEQQSLEIALQKFPKDTSARWDRIAEFVSTKTKEECVERYKIIVQQIKKKKGKGV